MANAVVIELGEDRSIADTDRPPRRGLVRTLVAALVAALVVLLVCGAEPVRPAFVALAEVPADHATVIALGPGAAFVAYRGDGALPGVSTVAAVAAYALPGGGLRWRTPIPQAVQSLRLQAGAGVVLAGMHGGDAGVDTAALDAETGRVLWSDRSTDLFHAPPGGTRGLLRQDAGGVETVRWADLRTGRTIWSRAVPDPRGLQPIFGGAASDPFRLLLLTPDGYAELLAADSGAVLAAGRLGDVGDLADAVMYPQVNVIGDRVLVLRQPAPGASTLAAFDLATFAARWTITGDFYGYPSPCGPLVCLAGTGYLTAVDPAAGTVAWRTERWQEGIIINNERLLALAHQPGLPMAVLDARTGRVVSVLTGWKPIYDRPAGRINLLVRADTRRYGRFWFAAVDADRAGWLLGSLSVATSEGCQTAGDLLACRTPRHTVQIWRYPTTSAG